MLEKEREGGGGEGGQDTNCAGDDASSQEALAYELRERRSVGDAGEPVFGRGRMPEEPAVLRYTTPLQPTLKGNKGRKWKKGGQMDG